MNTDNKSFETIFALSTARGKGGIAVIRVSGKNALESFRKITGISSPSPRKAYYSDLKTPGTDEIIDKAIAIFFSAPSSFTGDDMAEYHVHGSYSVIRKLLECLGKEENHRAAQAGEFTKNAFINGKMDLTEAEAVADLINAESEMQRIQALSQMSGSLSSLYSEWRERLAKILAYIEADIDFPDEDLPQGISDSQRTEIENLLSTIREHLNDGRRGERLREGINIAVIGKPNAGKSSLVNALAQRDAAIVSDFAGTTRDIIEVHLDLSGFPIILADTAGLKPSQVILNDVKQKSDNDKHGEIESEGIKRAIERAKQADIKILMFDIGDLPDLCNETLSLADKNSIIVFNKCDINNLDPVLIGKVINNIKTAVPDISVVEEMSVVKNKGIDQLINFVIKKSESLTIGNGSPGLTRQRHRKNLENCVNHLVLSLSEEQTMPELIAEEIRTAIKEIGKITGKVDVEELLDVIFRDFCIGK